jgi:hypothetical protein
MVRRFGNCEGQPRNLLYISGMRAALFALFPLLLAMTGCQAGPDERPIPSNIDPLKVVAALPAPAGLNDAEAATAADASRVAALFRSGTGRAAGTTLTDQGLLRAATRSWTTPKGGKMVVVVSVWRNRQTASGMSGRAAEQVLSLPTAQAWSPGDLRGARGAEALGAAPVTRAISRAVVQNGLYVESTGDVPAETVIRAMKRLSLLVEGGAQTVR